ncbi:nucleoside phosphorylase [Cesiribacter andamanensis]|uniref:Uridine phosphorylase n=1 Tax=Cesiribacter andamanensis AMV16 TaxID=1279009 RepID=M7NSJ4_9BACT|nr:nucleoside phosphorylase [Cesiribacter andamanensis]EMR01454.1 Uridine phosphorylase [Cesiribacter andamanensis AMV16]
MNRIPSSELVLNPDNSLYHLNLHPENIADTILTVGDPERVPRISKYFDRIELKVSKREYVTHTGYYGGKRLTVMSTGMGTDNIEVLMMELDALVNVDLVNRVAKPEQRSLNIIRVGTSGSLQPDIKVGDFLVSDYAVGLDALMFFYNLPNSPEEQQVAALLQEAAELPFTPYVVRGSQRLLEQVGHDMVRGNTLTSPGFYAPQGRRVRASLRLPRLIENLNQFRFLGDRRLTNFEMETAGYYAMGRILGHEVLSVNCILANRIENIFASNPDELVEKMIPIVLDRV